MVETNDENCLSMVLLELSTLSFLLLTELVVGKISVVGVEVVLSSKNGITPILLLEDKSTLLLKILVGDDDMFINPFCNSFFISYLTSLNNEIVALLIAELFSH